MIGLKLLGSAELEGKNGRLTGPAVQRHRLALLAVLVTAYPRALPREKIAALLWPDRDSEHVRNLLKQSVYVLRKALGDDAICSVGDALRLDATVIECDVINFEQAIVAGNFETAVRLYSGPFLDGFFLGDAQEFETWVIEQRTRLAEAYLQALEALGTGAEAQGDFRAALEWWKALAKHDPLHSPAILGLMRSLEAVGDPAGALRHAEKHALALREELGIKPPPELSKMVAHLQGLDSGERRPTASAPQPAQPAEQQPPVEPDKQRERSRLRPFVYAAAALAVAANLVQLRDLAPDERASLDGDVVDEIAQAVAREVARRRQGEPVLDRPERRTRSIAAYELYLTGSDPKALRSSTAARQAMENFQQAVKLDPTYAAAWAGLARLSMRVAYDDDENEQQLFALAEEAAQKAVQLDSSLAEAYETMGLLQTTKFDLPAAASWMQRAIALEPARATTRERLVAVYLWMNNPSQALAEAEQALKIDPLSPSASAELARALAASGRCEEALARLTALADVDPPLLRVPLIAAQCHVQQGKWQRAIEELEHAVGTRYSQLDQAFFGYVLARSGQRDKALRLLDTLQAQEQHGGGALPVVMLHAGLGDTELVFTWLERALADESLAATPDQFTLLQPVLEQLRGDPRLGRLSVLSPWAGPGPPGPAAVTSTGSSN